MAVAALHHNAWSVSVFLVAQHAGTAVHSGAADSHATGAAKSFHAKGSLLPAHQGKFNVTVAAAFDTFPEASTALYLNVTLPPPAVQ